MLVAKVHKSHRLVVALCDADLIGKKFEEDIRQLECRATFFKDQEISYEEAVKLIKSYAREDATFNIVGRHAIEAAQEAGLIDKDGFATIQTIPFTLILG